MRKGIEVGLGPGHRERLEAIVGRGSSSQKHVWRARIVLLSAAGIGTMAIQRRTGKGKPTIWRWQARFKAEGVDGLLHDATCPDGKAPLPPATIERVVAMTLAEPPGEATHWTCRAMAKAVGISHRSVQRIWASHGLKPHRIKTFKLSTDSKFAAKVQDVVGLYIDPPEHALVLSVDEKSQIQALDRTQPGLPMKKGRCGTMTHDYKRHGTTTLFAALDVLEGRVIGQCMARHRHQEFIRFLNKIHRETPPARELHLIIDNYATQASQGPRLARTASAISLPLHPDLGLLAQRRRGVLCQAHPAAAQARGFQRHRRSPDHDQPLPRRDQQKSEALHLDCRSRRDRREGPVRKTGGKQFWRGPMRLGLRLTLLAIGLASLLGTRHASAGSLIEFSNVSEQAPELVGYLARPDRGLSALLGGGGAPSVVQYPAVVVLHGCSGISSHSAAIADRLGSWGYVALAIDSLGPRGVADRCTRSGYPEEAFDAYAALRYLAQQFFVDPTRIAVLGQSMGGIAALYAVDRDMAAQYFTERFQAAIAYYPACLPPKVSLTAPTLILAGESDDWTPAERCREMVAHAQPDSAPIALHVYPDTYHAFDVTALQPGRRAFGHLLEYNEPAAKDAEEKTRAFLAAHLAGTSPAVGNKR